VQHSQYERKTVCRNALLCLINPFRLAEYIPLASGSYG